MTDYPLINALLFTLLGVAVFLAVLAVAEKLAPWDLRRELLEKQNVAVAIVAAAVALGLSLIVSSAMH